jgi:hypothetical protein
MSGRGTQSHDEHAAGAADPDPRAADGVVAETLGTAPDHAGAGHGHDDHGSDDEALGPIDWAMWGVGALSVALGLVVAAGLAAASGFVPGA